MKFVASQSTCLKRMYLLILVVSLIPLHAAAQMDQGSIVGSIRDATGAVIPGATVHLQNPSTAFVLDRTSAADGSYVFTPIKIGTYTVTVTAAGFASATVNNIVVTASSRVEVPFSMQTGSVTATVNVTSAPPALQTEDSSTGATVSAVAIVQTPLLNRNPMFIAQLTPGVNPATSGSRGATTGDFSANGQRPEQNNYILDGVDNNSPLVDIANFSSYVIKPLPDGLAEFKIQTSNYSAEFGHGAGAIVNQSIKSGTNQFHGSLWEFWRNDILNATDRFATFKPKYRQNQFGATIGGPFIPNKLFFFGDVEANRILFGLNSLYTVPTLKMRTGDFTELLNPSLTANNTRTLYVPGSAGTVLQQCNGIQNVICPANVNTIAANILAHLPAPNTGVPGQTYNNYRFQGAGGDDTVQYDGRLDWNINTSDQAFARYSVSNELVNFDTPFGILDGYIAGQTIKGRNFTASETHFFSPTLDNELRFGYNWLNAAASQYGANIDVSAELGLGGVPYAKGQGGTPSFGMSNVSSFGSSGSTPTDEFANVIQLLDNMTKVKGKHTIRFGINFQRIRVQTLQPPTGRGRYTYTGAFTQIPGHSSNTGFDVADLIQDQMASANITSTVTVHNQRWYRSGYVQDDWRISPKLTLNLGLRYEYFQPLEELNDNQANFVANWANNTATFYLANSKTNQILPAPLLASFAANHVTVAYTGNRSLIDAQKSDFSPRVGFAYQINSGLVVHGGFGMFYGGLEGVGFSPNLGLNLPFSGSASATSGACVPGSCPNDGITLETGFTTQINEGLANSASLPVFHMYPASIRTPVTESFNLSVQKNLGHDTVATLAYVGALGRHLTSLPGANYPDHPLAPGANVQVNRPFNAFGAGTEVAYGGVSSYNGGQAILERRLSHGLYFLSSYVFSKDLGDASSPLNNAQKQTRNYTQLGLGYDYGPSYNDTRHRFVFNAQYELPFGKGRRFLNDSTPMDIIAGGWNMTLVFRTQTGQPIVMNPNNNPTNGGGTGADAVRISDPFSTTGTNPGTGVICATKVRTISSWFNPCSYTNPPVATGPNDIASYGPPGAQMVYGPGYNRIDMSLSKDFHLYREWALRFRADLFNAFNTPSLGQPGNTIGSGFGVITSSRFGGSGLAAESPDARVAQLSARLSF